MLFGREILLLLDTRELRNVLLLYAISKPSTAHEDIEGFGEYFEVADRCGCAVKYGEVMFGGRRAGAPHQTHGAQGFLL
jgi:hypothetical protein